MSAKHATNSMPADWVKYARMYLKESQQGLASMLGVTRKTVWMWEHGQADCRGAESIALLFLQEAGDDAVKLWKEKAALAAKDVGGNPSDDA